MESIIPVDEKCTAWVQEFLGFSMKQCCIAHDYGGSDEALMQCVANLSPWMIPMALLMYTGVKFGKPLYKKYLQWRERK